MLRPCQVLSWKHPRVCGEDRYKQLTGIVELETPPRMRGRLAADESGNTRGGNTPAYAGKTTSGEDTKEWREKHPRVCGEDLERNMAEEQKTETPPRMRGRLHQSGLWFDRLRNTPAYAGKTLSVNPLAEKREKHPRVCGEDHVECDIGL